MLNQQVDLTQLPVAPTLHWSEAFGAWLHATDRKPLTIKAYVQDMQHFFGQFDELNAANVKTYFARQDADNRVKPSTRNRRLASMRVFVQWAVEAEGLEADPTVGVKRVEVELSPRDRTPEEMSALEGVAQSHSHLKRGTEAHALLGQRDALIWNLFENAGLRISELATLKIADVDLEAMTIHVLGKGGKKADVYIPQCLVEAIAAWLEVMPAPVTGHLVTDWHGRGLHRSQIHRRLKLMGEAAGVKDLKAHDIRHTFVYSMVDTALAMGMNLPTAMDAARKQVRHKDMRTTMKFYLHARASQVRAVVEAR